MMKLKNNPNESVYDYNIKYYEIIKPYFKY